MTVSKTKTMFITMAEWAVYLQLVDVVEHRLPMRKVGSSSYSSVMSITYKFEAYHYLASCSASISNEMDWFDQCQDNVTVWEKDWFDQCQDNVTV